MQCRKKKLCSWEGSEKNHQNHLCWQKGYSNLMTHYDLGEERRVSKTGLWDTSSLWRLEKSFFFHLQLSSVWYWIWTLTEALDLYVHDFMHSTAPWSADWIIMWMNRGMCVPVKMAGKCIYNQFKITIQRNHCHDIQYLTVTIVNSCWRTLWSW